ncbi:phosphatase PAP2 family protein [Nitrobacter sp.]|uniref:phosphatase PAP2 family protein n=1 Tax=Nitrobacter sp. TaxID=29420 RepID=UPI00399D58DE
MTGDEFARNSKPPGYLRLHEPSFPVDAMSTLTTTIMALDKEILLAFNAFGGRNQSLWDLANNSLFRGFPLFFSIVALWFANEQPERRARMLAGLLAVCLATMLSVWSQFHTAVHIRPIIDLAIPLDTVIPRTPWDRTNSFPSDTATLFFALAAVVFVEKRSAGLFCFVWVAAIVAIPRIIVGLHYPSDVIGAFVLGLASVFIFTGFSYPKGLFRRLLAWFEGRMYIVHALLFIFLAEAFDLFPSLQALGKLLARLLHAQSFIQLR